MHYNYIIEGNSLEVLEKMEDESVDIVITSPPYNAAHNYDVYDDNIDDLLYLSTMEKIFTQVYRVLKKDGRICLNIPFAIKNKESKKVNFLAHEYAGMLNNIGFNDFEWITWHKGKNKNHFQGNNTAWGSWKSPSCPSFRPMGESVMVFFKNERRMIRDKGNIDITGDEFKNWTKNLWYFDEEEENIYENLIMAPNTASKKEHPAPFPVELVERLLKLYSYQESLVLDPFNGIGTTSLAAEKLNRKFIGIDLSKSYCDIAVNRLESDKVKRITINKEFSNLVNSDDVVNSLNEFFPYKESFSPKLFNELINRYSIEEFDSMYDPFLGTGSSFINNKVKDIYGVDVSPFALKVSNVKLNKIDKEDGKRAIKLAKRIDEIQIQNYEMPNWGPYTKYVEVGKFNIIKTVIDEFKRISREIGEYVEYLLYSNLEKIFDYKRDGNGIKYRKSKIMEEDLMDYLSLLITGGINIKLKFDEANSIQNINLEKKSSTEYVLDNNIDIVITSPPYANMFDYFEVYKMELWTSGLIKDYAGWRELKKSALRSNLNSQLNENDNIDNSLLYDIIGQLKEKDTEKKIITMIQNYFYDMKKVLENMYKSMKPGGYAFVVVGNSFYSGIPVVTDFILAEEAEKIGFRNEDIIFARTLRTSPQQMKIIDDSNKKYLRESIIVLRKE